jgi:apyrase
MFSGYIRKMAGGGVTYNVYVWSYLGYGLMQGRGAVLGAPGSGSCINAGATGSFKSPYGDGASIPLESAPTGGDVQECKKAVIDAMHLQKDCGSTKMLCTFDGAWGAVESHEGRPFYVSSYFFDKYALLGLCVCFSPVSCVWNHMLFN